MSVIQNYIEELIIIQLKKIIKLTKFLGIKNVW